MIVDFETHARGRRLRPRDQAVHDSTETFAQVAEAIRKLEIALRHARRVSAYLDENDSAA